MRRPSKSGKTTISIAGRGCADTSIRRASGREPSRRGCAATNVMIDATHSVARRSWVASANGHADFPIQNLPLGVFTPGRDAARGGVAIGDEILDLAAAVDLGLFDAQAAPAAEAASGTTLNPLFALGRGARVALRRRLSEILDADGPARARIEGLRARLLHRA